MRKIVLTFFGAGLLRPAPGTWGSLAAIPAAWGLHLIGSFWLLAAATPALYYVGVRQTRAEIAGSDGDHDPSWIVIDEAVGMWIALWPVSYGAMFAGVSFWALWPGVLVAFAAFRFFDIRKPWLVGRADARGDATGVMLDDVWAGVFAALVVVVLGVVAHAWIIG